MEKTASQLFETGDCDPEKSDSPYFVVFKLPSAQPCYLSRKQQISNLLDKKINICILSYIHDLFFHIRTTLLHKEVREIVTELASDTECQGVNNLLLDWTYPLDTVRCLTSLHWVKLSEVAAHVGGLALHTGP